MTTEEKARAYDEALKKIQPLYEQAKKDDNPIWSTYEYLFPELRESEDKRVMKEIIQFFRDASNSKTRVINSNTFAEWATYLEKQEERSMSAEEVLTRAGLKPYKDGNKWCILAGNNIQEGICGFGDTIDEALYQFLMEVLEIQKKQKPINNSTREKIISKASNEKQVVLLSESDGNAEIGWDTRSLEDTKKLLEYGIAFINKQLGTKPAEWSEEDTEGYINVASSLRGYACGLENEEHKRHIQKGLDWLENRFKSPRPTFKPSEEQMEALEECGECKRCIKELREQLKKL